MNKPMKYLYLLCFVFFLQTSLAAQSKVVLGEEEIRKSPYTKFENRSDKFATPERKAIEVEIGKGLHAQVIETDKPINYKGFTLQRFYSDEPGKFGGDILVLNKNANYGHINSIKRILNSYIQTSFEYTEKNADILVMEVLYYNAQNRQKLDRIKKRYTKSLVAALNKNKVGIGKKFSDWPGNTQIVIPIKSAGFSKSTEDISEKKPEDKKETPTNEKTPVTEKEKIKITKEKIPSSDMPKENITNTSKSTEEKKSSKSDEAIIKEEKKNIEIRIQKDKEDSPFTESEVKQPEKNKPTSDIKTPTKIEETKDSKDDSKKEEDNTDKTDEKKTLVPDDSTKEIKKEESKKVPDETPPTKEISKNTTTKEEKPTLIVEKLPIKETVKEIKKEEKPTTTKESKIEEPKKETAKSVVVNETKSVPTKEVTTDKPVVKETKTPEQPKKVEEPKKAEEPKKETPKKETTSNPPAKTVVDKIPTTKTEIKKMHKELVELKAKEKDKVENSDNVVGEKIVFLKVKEFLAEGHYSSEMWAVDTENDDELFQSPFKKVCGKEFKELGTGVVVMSFKDNDMLKTDTHHLALLDKDSLKLIRQTNEIIFWRSFVKEQSGKIYAVEFKDGKYYLAQFKDDLTFEMRSSDPINPDCEIAFKKNKIYLTKRGTDDSEVSIRVLNRDNLKLRDLKVVK